MCSEGSKATVVHKGFAKDIEIKGKPSMLLTVARSAENVEILNRFNIITLDETVDQTKRIAKRQAKMAVEGKTDRYDNDLLVALAELKERKIKIPYAEKLPKYFSFGYLRARRDFARFLDLIKASVALYQFQRKEKDGFLIASDEDYEHARNISEVINPLTIIGLSRKLKYAFDSCKELNDFKIMENQDQNSQSTLLGNVPAPIGFTAKEIWAYAPIVGLQQWYEYLNILCQKNLLEIQLSKEEKGRPAAIYSIVPPKQNLYLPSFDEL